jgi:hypothetical protein
MKAGTVVTCINDKNLPEGADVVKGREEIIISSRMNTYGQKIVFLVGRTNNGTTSKGLEWNGYDATRFADPTAESIEEEEVAYAMN